MFVAPKAEPRTGDNQGRNDVLTTLLADEASDEADVIRRTRVKIGRRDVSHPDVDTASLSGMSKTPRSRGGTRGTRFRDPLDSL